MSRPGHRLWLAAVVVLLAGSGAWWSAQRRSRATSAEVDLRNGRPKLLDFGMGVCEQCQKMKPVMERAARELGDRLEVHVLDLRDARTEQLAERYQLRVVPLIVLADGAGNALWRHEGFVDYATLSRAVEERLERR